MSLPRNLFASAFRRQRLGLIFTVITAIMVYLGTLTVAVPVAMTHANLAWKNDAASRMTVAIPDSITEDDKTAQIERATRVMTALKAMPEVENATPVSPAESARLLKPWIGDPSVLAALPLPIMLDVKIKNSSPLDADAMRQRLIPIASDISVDRHADWVANLMRLTRAVGILASVTALLAGLTLMIVIGLICRAAMAVQHETIELLHLIGAGDEDIARQFRRYAVRLAWPAAAAGFAAAIVTIGALAALISGFTAQPLKLGDSFWLLFGAALTIAPLAAIAGAALTAHASVLGILRRMP